MDNQLVDEEKQRSSGSDASLQRSITREEFVNYFSAFEEKFGEMECPLCKNKEWGIAPRDDNQEYPALVTLPLPHSAGRGFWAFPVFCAECGYIATFSAHHVTKIIREG